MQHSPLLVFLIVVSLFVAFAAGIRKDEINAKPRGIIVRDYIDKENEQLLIQSQNDVLTELYALLDPSAQADRPCSASHTPPQSPHQTWESQLIDSCLYRPLRLRAGEVNLLKRLFSETVSAQDGICPPDWAKYQLQRATFAEVINSFVDRQHLRNPTEAADWLSTSAACVARLAFKYSKESRGALPKTGRGLASSSN
eukprot:TRINITY_DN1872_c0_g1_i1.p1 TRINITY_DN1872_c0_g1~~TRINITY_DN1872_c0_g1_i1.p1  ORF type:complete len:198 (-),score=42.22 TRINITY_DN1872_c0_g1_i1:136-729(-)